MSSAEKSCRDFFPGYGKFWSATSLAQNVNQPHYPTAIPEPQYRNSISRRDLKTSSAPSQIDTNGEVRLRHGHGHTQEEMYAIKYTQLGRIPDLVVYPKPRIKS